MALLSAGIVFTLAGCQKGTTPNHLNGKAFQFGAKAGSVDTRTAFSGEGTQSGTSVDEFSRKILTHERINWKENDAVLIASDNATIYGDRSTKYATYTVAKVTPNGDISEAELNEKAGSEELFFNENEKYTFWGIYPAAAGKGSDLVDAKANYTISSSQAPTGALAPITSVDGKKELTPLDPDMSQAVMLAAAENQTEESVVLDFYPGFTAFEFTLNSAEADIVLKELVLKPASAEKSLAGDVAVNEIKTGGATFNSTGNYKITYPETKPVTYTFPAGTTITKNNYVTFTVFAVPETIEGLTLEFHLGEDGSEIQTATLKQTVDGVKKDISFAGCKKHCLRGIAVKGGWTFKYLTLDIDVLDWIPVEIEESNGKGVQATQFAVSFNDEAEHNLRNVKGNDKNYRQCWVFAPTHTVTTGEGEETTTTTETTVATVTYKIMMPTSGTWSIEKCGDTDAFTVSVQSSGGAVTSSGNFFSGALSTGATYITITLSSEASSLKTLYFKTTASDGTSTFSLDSETQLYDMRGYHYFIVNGTAATTFDDLNI